MPSADRTFRFTGLLGGAMPAENVFFFAAGETRPTAFLSIFFELGVRCLRTAPAGVRRTVVNLLQTGVGVAGAPGMHRFQRG